MRRVKVLMYGQLDVVRFWVCVTNSLYLGVVIATQNSIVPGAVYDAIEYLPGTKFQFGLVAIISSFALLLGRLWLPKLLRITHAAAASTWFIVGFYAVLAWSREGGSPALLMGLFFTLAYLNFSAAVVTPALRVTGLKRE